MEIATNEIIKKKRGRPRKYEGEEEKEQQKQQKLQNKFKIKKTSNNQQKQIIEEESLTVVSKIENKINDNRSNNNNNNNKDTDDNNDTDIDNDNGSCITKRITRSNKCNSNDNNNNNDKTETDTITPSSSSSSSSLSTTTRETRRSSQNKPFTSCLKTFNEVTSSTGANLTFLLKRAMSIEELDDTSWLTSTLIDLVFSQFAKQYTNVDYLPIDFLLYTLNSKSNFDGLTDILGRILQYKQHRPVIFLWNKNNIHWTLIRANFLPTPELQLFEPMGKLPSRIKGKTHLSYRYVPRDVVRWLDTCYPLENGQSWINVSTSAITNQQQYTSFDCGVACLLYAEKCGLGQTKEIINTSTTQEDITSYRRDLQEFMRKINQVHN